LKFSKHQLWGTLQKYYTEFPTIGLALDLSRMNFAMIFFARMEPAMQKAFAAMAELEKAAIANPDENGWLGITGFGIPLWPPPLISASRSRIPSSR